MCCHRPCISALPFRLSLAGQKRTPRRGEQQGWSDSRGSDVTLDRVERRSYRECRPSETERQADFTPEKFMDEKYVLQTSAGRTRGPEGLSEDCQTLQTLWFCSWQYFADLANLITSGDT